MGYAKELSRLKQRMHLADHCGYDRTTEQLVLANILNLCPNISWAEMRAKARAAAFNQERAILDLHFGQELLRHVVISDPFDMLSAPDPKIFVASHIGGYRLVVPALIARGLSVTLVVDSQVADAQQVLLTEQFAAYCAAAQLNPDVLRIRDTSQAGLLIGMARDLGQGRSLVLYLDGNKGMNTASHDHLVEVEFMGNILGSRSGIPRVSMMTGAPMVPVSMSRGRKLTENCMMIGNKIPYFCNTNEKFVKLSLQKLWNGISEEVSRDISSWEAIRYIHLSMSWAQSAMPNSYDSSRLCFDKRRYGFVMRNAVGEIFDRKTYKLMKTNGRLADLVSILHELPERSDVSELGLDTDVVAWLSQRSLLVSLGGLPT